MFSILHISDLHRSVEDPITNGELISALLIDRDHYIHEDPPIPVPEAIIVSGDIIQGVPGNVLGYKEEIKEQYEVAEQFLSELTKRFLNDDRSRVILVPGNHDICWNTARKAMSLVGMEEAPSDLRKELLREESQYRWNWKTRELYKITDTDLYKNRLADFWEFFRKFYEETELLKVSPGNDVNLFLLHDGRIGVAAFNSCHGNDCFAFHGHIPREVIARSYMDLKDTGLNFDLQLAVWHHSIVGPPYGTDYMDVDIVRGMIGRNFRLGLYGHQHKTLAEPHRIYLPDQETMAVVSAGSLCAGTNDLPTGVNRQYTIVELADNLLSAKVHVRTMIVSNLFGKGSLNTWSGRSFAELDWQPPKNAAGQPIDIEAEHIRLATEEAEKSLKEDKPTAAVERLLPFADSLKDYSRKLLLNAAWQVEDWSLVVQITSTPITIEELVFRVKAAIKLKKFEISRTALNKFEEPLQMPSSTTEELHKFIDVEEVIGK